MHVKRFSLLKTRSRYWLRSDDDRDSEADETCPTRLVEMSWQCEACGPDLELYENKQKTLWLRTLTWYDYKYLDTII